MKNLILLTALMNMVTGGLALAQGVGAGGGGNVIDLRTYYDRALSETDLDQLLQNNGLKLKKGLIIPMIKYVTPSMIDDQVAKSNFNLITADRKLLEDDIIFSIFEYGTCEPDHDACVEKNAPFSKIIFDKQSLLAKHTSLGDLGGLVIHEYEHKYGHPEHTKYALGKFFKERIEAKKHIGQVFSISANEITSKSALSIQGNAYPWYVVYITPRDQAQAQADLYCQWRHYNSALNYKTTKLPPSYFTFFVITADAFGQIIASKNYTSGDSFRSNYWFEISEVTCIY